MKRSLPWLSLALVAVAAAAWAMPGHGAWLGWEPGAAPWRLFTSQLAHWDPDHLLWDGLAVLILGAYAESRWSAPTRLALALGLVLVPLTVVAVHPGLAFRGLSGLACTLALVAAIATWREARLQLDLLGMLLGGGLLLGLLAKTAYELLTADAVFASAATWQPVPVAHLAGMVAALCLLIHPRPEPVPAA